MKRVKIILVILAGTIVLGIGFLSGAKFFPRQPVGQAEKPIYREVLKEENVITRVVDEVTPSVVTVGVKKTQTIIGWLDTPIEEDIGSGFIISQDEGLVITNKHVVADLQAEYKVITADNTALPVEKIYRDPVNDLAI